MAIPVFTTFGGLNGLLSGSLDLHGLAGLIPLLNDFGNRAIAEMMFEAQKLFEEGLDLSQALVHVITGELKGSGVVQVTSSNVIEFRYDKEYAEPEEYREGGKYQTHSYFRPAFEYISSNLETRMVQALERHVSSAATA